MPHLDTKLKRLQEAAVKLYRLLIRDPEPGLFTWHDAVHSAVQDVVVAAMVPQSKFAGVRLRTKGENFVDAVLNLQAALEDLSLGSHPDPSVAGSPITLALREPYYSAVRMHMPREFGSGFDNDGNMLLAGTAIVRGKRDGN